MKEKKVYVRETKKQRQWILRRDEFQCQFIDPKTGKKCGVRKHLEIHHIVPVVWAYEHLHWTPEQVNHPENLITLCRRHHQRFIHPDFGIIAKRQYKYATETYKLASERHIALAKKGVPYWQTFWDDILKMTARLRTFEYLRKHLDDPFPLEKQENKGGEKKNDKN